MAILGNLSFPIEINTELTFEKAEDLILYNADSAFDGMVELDMLMIQLNKLVMGSQELERMEWDKQSQLVKNVLEEQINLSKQTEELQSKDRTNFTEEQKKEYLEQIQELVKRSEIIVLKTKEPQFLEDMDLFVKFMMKTNTADKDRIRLLKKQIRETKTEVIKDILKSIGKEEIKLTEKQKDLVLYYIQLQDENNLDTSFPAVLQS